MRASLLLPSLRVGTCLGAAALLSTAPSLLHAQRDDQSRVRHGIAIGDVPRVKGVRLNFRDRHLERVDGVNVTIWTPHDPMRGDVHGIALGLPATGAGNIEGAAIGIFGAGATGRIDGLGLGLAGLGSGDGMQGLMLGGIGIGSGGRLEGVSIGGIGVGAGDDVSGLTLGGIGVGSGGDLWGIQVAGIGLGSGGDLTGLTVGGIGAGGGGDVTGITIAGIGVGAGGRMKGIQLAGIGIGGGGGMTGLQVAGVGIGSGGRLKGISIAGVGVGAPRIEGFVAAAAAGGREVTGVVLAPVFFRIEDDGELHGAALSAYNRIRGTQRGVTIGIVNYARRLDGVQFGLVNIVRENPDGRRVLPLVNWGR